MMSFSQDKLTNPKLTRSQKHQTWHEHTKEQLRQNAGLGMSVAQFHKLQENDPSLEKFRKGSGKEVVLSRIVCGTISGHLSCIVDTQ